LDDDFVREHCWGPGATLGAVTFHGGDVERIPRRRLVKSRVEVDLRWNVDQEVLARKLVRRARRLLLSIPELLTFVIYFS